MSLEILVKGELHTLEWIMERNVVLLCVCVVRKTFSMSDDAKRVLEISFQDELQFPFHKLGKTGVM